MMFMLFVGMGWAQVTTLEGTDPNKCYTLTAPRSGLCVESANATSVSTWSKLGLKQDSKDLKQQFAFVKRGDAYYLYSVFAKKFVNKSKPGNDDDKANILKENMGQPLTFENGAMDGRPNGVKIKVGTSRLNIDGQKSLFIDGYSNTDDGNSFLVEEAGAFVFEPFKVSTLNEDGTFGENMHWYKLILPNLNIHPNANCVLEFSGTNNSQVISEKAFNDNFNGAQMFAFVGNATDGYQIYNYAAGSGKVLWSGTPDSDNARLCMMAKEDQAKTAYRWGFQTHTRYDAQYFGYSLVRKDVENAYISRKSNGIGYWIDKGAANDPHSCFDFVDATNDMAMKPAVLKNDTYAISFTNSKGVKKYLTIANNTLVSLSDTPVQFEVSAGVAQGFASEGVYFLTLNGRRISNYKTDNGEGFKTDDLSAGTASQNWCTQVIKRDPLTGKYAIRCTNVQGNAYLCDRFITHNDDNVTATVSDDINNKDLYQWDIELVNPYAFSLTKDDVHPRVYAVYADRGFAGKWLTLDNKGKIDLTAYSEGNFNQFVYFKETTVDGSKRIQMFPIMGQGQAFGNLNNDNAAGNVQIQNATEASTKWEYVAKGQNAFGLKVSGQPRYLSNYQGEGKKLGLWQDGPAKDDGSRFLVKEITNYEELVAAVNAKAAKKAALVEKLTGKANFVGYPVNAEASVAKLNAITGETLNDKVECATVYDEVMASEINKPVAGKAYTFKNVGKNGKAYFMTTNNEAQSSWTEDAKLATAYVCQKVGNKYMFVNNAGKYMSWFDNNTNGMESAYTVEICDFNIVKMVKGGEVKVENEALLGYVSMFAKRKTADTRAGYIVVDSNNGGNSGADKAYFSDTHSSAIIMEEVSYANNPKLNAIEGNMVSIAGQTKISTFSAPFATVIPANVKAFYIKKADKKENTAILTAVAEGEAIPANTGVILTGNAEAGENAVMVPATTETVATIADNALANTAGAAKDMSQEGSFYLLGKYTGAGENNGKVGFFLGNAGTLKMNKAYLPVANAQAQAIKLVFGDEVTGIEGVEAEENVNAPIYDLSGRRVLSTVKGGIYIQNGKKFIVK